MSRSPSAGSGPWLPPAVIGALRAALALVAPCDCAGCGAPDIELCAECREKLAGAPVVTALPDGTPLVSGLAYEGVVRDVVLAFKQAGRFRLARQLGPALAAALGEVRGLEVSSAVPGASAAPGVSAASGVRREASAIAVLAVPASRAGRRRRGYEPVELLVRAAGAVCARPGLGILRASGSQKSRSRLDRFAARSGTMRCPAFWTGRRVVVVDDVATSGATLLEAVRAAREAGAEVVAACCLAATPLMSAKVP